MDEILESSEKIVKLDNKNNIITSITDDTKFKVNKNIPDENNSDSSSWDFNLDAFGLLQKKAENFKKFMIKQGTPNDNKNNVDDRGEEEEEEDYYDV